MNNDLEFSWADYDTDFSPVLEEEKPKKASKKKDEDFSFDWDTYDIPIAEEKLEETEESFEKSAIRTAAQLPQAYLTTTGPGLAGQFWQALALGEALDPEEIERIEQISEQMGKPFDREKYMEAVQNALKYVPTVSNIAREIEEQTDFPLEPKTKVQKALRLGGEAVRLSPGTIAQKTVAGVAAPTVSTVLQAAGVPEPFADIVGFGAGIPAGALAPAETKLKPSGLVERQFETLTKPREVSAKRMQVINQTLEKDFRGISDKIIEESPIGETFENLKNDATFKQQTKELLNEAQNVANEIPGEIATTEIKKEIADISSKKQKGYAASEYDKSYNKFTKDALEEIEEKNITAGQLVEQYRKNNAELTEYFEPGSSKAHNRAKRDALLDHNRAIANLIEKKFPESELPTIFKEGNDRWSKIMDAEAIDSFLEELFPKEGKLNYKKIHDFFDIPGYSRPFKRALGEKGFKEFESLVKDMSTSERAYKMLQVAKQKGFGDLAETAGAFILHPNLGKAKLGYEFVKGQYKNLMNTLLDKPQLTSTWKKAVNDLEKGNFEKATTEFKTLKKEIEKA